MKSLMINSPLFQRGACILPGFEGLGAFFILLVQEAPLRAACGPFVAFRSLLRRLLRYGGYSLSPSATGRQGSRGALQIACETGLPP